MIDTCNFWLDSTAMGTVNPFAVADYLTDTSVRESEKKGVGITGNLGNYIISINERGIFFSGSLAKFYLPSNVFTLTRATVKEALEKISDQLHVNVGAARLTRVDVSTVLPTKQPPANYYNYLGDKPHFARLQASADTLYYNTKKRQLVFYDKTKEAKSKGAIIPPALSRCNLFRYEVRFVNRLRQQFNQDQPTTALLFEPNFYCWLIRQWKKEFDTIKKLKANFMIDNVKRPNEAINIFLGSLIQKNGGQNAINDFLSDLKAKKTFSRPADYTRVKNKLMQMQMTPTKEPQQNDLIIELETAIADVARYAR